MEGLVQILPPRPMLTRRETSHKRTDTVDSISTQYTSTSTSSAHTDSTTRTSLPSSPTSPKFPKYNWYTQEDDEYNAGVFSNPSVNDCYSPIDTFLDIVAPPNSVDIIERPNTFDLGGYSAVRGFGGGDDECITLNGLQLSLEEPPLSRIPARAENLFLMSGHFIRSQTGSFYDAIPPNTPPLQHITINPASSLPSPKIGSKVSRQTIVLDGNGEEIVSPVSALKDIAKKLLLRRSPPSTSTPAAERVITGPGTILGYGMLIPAFENLATLSATSRSPDTRTQSIKEVVLVCEMYIMEELDLLTSHLSKFPNLTSISLLDSQDDPPTDSTTLRRIITRWNKACPKLVCVYFSTTSRWVLKRRRNWLIDSDDDDDEEDDTSVGRWEQEHCDHGLSRMDRKVVSSFTTSSYSPASVGSDLNGNDPYVAIQRPKSKRSLSGLFFGHSKKNNPHTRKSRN